MLIINQSAREDFRTFMMAHHREAEPVEVIRVLKSKPKSELPEILCPWIVRNPEILLEVIKEFGLDVIPKTYRDEYRNDIGLASWEEAGLYGYIGEKMNSISLKHHYNPKDKYLADLENLVASLKILKNKGFQSGTTYVRDSAIPGNTISIDYGEKLNRIMLNERDVFNIIYKNDLMKEVTQFLHDNLNISKFQMEQIAEVLWYDGYVFWSFMEYVREGKLHSYQNKDMDARRLLQKYDTTVLEAHNYWAANEMKKRLGQGSYERLTILERKSPMKAHLAAENIIRFAKLVFKMRKSHKRFVVYVDEHKDSERPYFYGKQCEFLHTYQTMLKEIPAMKNGDDNLEYRIAFFETPGNWIEKEKPYMIMYLNNNPDPSLKIAVWDRRLTLFKGETLEEQVSNMIKMYNREFNCNYVLQHHEVKTNETRVIDEFYFEIVRE